MTRKSQFNVQQLPPFAPPTYPTKHEGQALSAGNILPHDPREVPIDDQGFPHL
jgi:hypothetical protein